MGKMQEARMSAVQLDGLLHKIPGLASGLNGDQLPFFINSSVLTLHTAQAQQDAFTAPMDMTIVGYVYNLLEVPGTANADVYVGTYGTAQAFAAAADLTMATTDSTGVVVGTDLSGWASVSIAQGDVVVFGTDGGSTTTGLASITLICIPR